MKNYVITIARGFGSGGKQVGLALSRDLGIPCYESQILALASEYSGINK
ncbi:MAG: cytidylate kinase-like family protein, partial [Treponema sp.]|nr:cytidylate kinase-like family protein [Treponema sp.]